MGRRGGGPSSRLFLGRVTQLLLLYPGHYLLGLVFPSFCFRPVCDLESHVSNIQSYPTSFLRVPRETDRAHSGSSVPGGGMAARLPTPRSVLSSAPDPFPLPGPLAQTLTLFLCHNRSISVNSSAGQGSRNRARTNKLRHLGLR